MYYLMEGRGGGLLTGVDRLVAVECFLLVFLVSFCRW